MEDNDNLEKYIKSQEDWLKSTQPIADERDDYRKLLEKTRNYMNDTGLWASEMYAEIQTILSKYPKTDSGPQGEWPGPIGSKFGE